MHDKATRHTKAFARDIRAAFAPVLPRQDDSAQQRLTYCKLTDNGLTGNSGNSGNGGNTSSGDGATTYSGHAGSGGGWGTATGSASSAAPTGSSFDSPWKLVQELSGSNFFDESNWEYWSQKDPTNGFVDYLTASDGWANNLLEINDDGHAIMRVETTDTVGDEGRKSIRIHSKSTYNTGTLSIMDAKHMPTGCGSWPAWWSNGPNWPIGGEIDILEGVNDYTNNQYTIHTDSGCQLTTDDASKLDITGTVVGGTNCAAHETGNQGCGVRSPSSVSFGAAFNGNNGGVYALSWTDEGLAIWFWPTDEVPDDVTAGTPVPSTWGTAAARWAASGCDPNKYFYDNTFIFDTTFCGDWAGSAWSNSGLPGQEESCAARTGYSTCEDYVRNKGGSFTEAYWEIRSVKFYGLK